MSPSQEYGYTTVQASHSAGAAWSPNMQYASYVQSPVIQVRVEMVGHASAWAGFMYALGRLLPCPHALKVCVLSQARSIQPVQQMQPRQVTQVVQQPVQVTQVVQQPIVEQLQWEPVVQHQVVEHVQWEPVQEVRAPALSIPSSLLPGRGCKPPPSRLAIPVASPDCNPVTRNPFGIACRMSGSIPGADSVRGADPLGGARA